MKQCVKKWICNCLIQKRCHKIQSGILGKEAMQLMQSLNKLDTPEQKLETITKKHAELVSYHDEWTQSEMEKKKERKKLAYLSSELFCVGKDTVHLLVVTVCLCSWRSIAVIRNSWRFCRRSCSKSWRRRTNCRVSTAGLCWLAVNWRDCAESCRGTTRPWRYLNSSHCRFEKRSTEQSR